MYAETQYSYNDYETVLSALFSFITIKQEEWNYDSN